MSDPDSSRDTETDPVEPDPVDTEPADDSVAPVSVEDGSASCSLDVDLQDMLEALPGVEAVRLGSFPDGDAVDPETPVLLVVARLAPRDLKRRQQVAAAMLQALRRQGRVAVPVLLDAQEWQDLERDGEGDPLALLAPQRRHLQRFAELQRQPGHPAPARRWLLKIIAQHRDAVNTVVSTAVVPEPVAVDICLAVLRDLFELIFASVGEVFSADRHAYGVLERVFADAPELGSADLDLYFELLGLREQVAERRAAPRARRAASKLGWPTRRLRELLGRCERYVDRTLSNEQTRARRRRLRQSLVAAIALGLVALAGVAWLASRPVGPARSLADASLAGGIETIYFKGKDLKNEVARRVTPRVQLNTRAAPIPELGADKFSIRWQGFVYLDSAGTQQICADSDDGKRVYFNDSLLIDDWKAHRKKRICQEIRAQKGWYPLRFDFFESGGAAIVKLMHGPNREKLKEFEPRELCCGTVSETVK